MPDRFRTIYEQASAGHYWELVKVETGTAKKFQKHGWYLRDIESGEFMAGFHFPITDPIEIVQKRATEHARSLGCRVERRPL